MNWARTQEAIRVLVSEAARIPLERVQWQDTAQAGTWRAYPCVDLVLKNPLAVGTDSFVRVDSRTDDAPLEIQQVGARTFSVEVRIETTNQTPGAESVGQLAGDLRSRLNWPALRERLSDSGSVAIARVQATLDANFNSDDRTHSLSITSVLFNAAENLLDTSDSGDYFDSLEVTSETLDHADGPAPVQIHLIIPQE